MKREAATSTRKTPPVPQPDPAPADHVLDGEQEELLQQLLAALEARGVPEGAWLIDIARVRRSLQEADGLMRRLEDAIIRGASSSSPLE